MSSEFASAPRDAATSPCNKGRLDSRSFVSTWTPHLHQLGQTKRSTPKTRIPAQRLQYLLATRPPSGVRNAVKRNIHGGLFDLAS